MAVVSPEKMCTLPPRPVLPLPTVIVIEPALPLVEYPVPIDRVPESPLLVVPELKLSRPLTPLLPELTVRIVIEPLDVDEP